MFNFILKVEAVALEWDLVGVLVLLMVAGIGCQGSHFKEWNLMVRRKVIAWSCQNLVQK